jgi:hypothetical protein
VVIEFEPVRRSADLDRVEAKFAASSRALPDLALHVRRHRVRLRRRRLLARLLDEPLPLRSLLEEQVQPGFEELARARAGHRVGERVLGRLELREERAGDGQVEPRDLAVERHGRVAERGRRRRCEDERHRRGDRRLRLAHAACNFYFGRPKLVGGRTRRGRRPGSLGEHRRRDGTHLRHDVTERDDLCRADGDRHQLRLAAGETEEPWQHLAPVLGGQHLRDLDDGRQAEPALPERGLDLGELLNELGRGLAVLGRASGETELAAQVREERGVAELAPELPGVEVREVEEEVGHGALLGAEEDGEVVRAFTRGRHERHHRT